jgi:hypothetical protein
MTLHTDKHAAFCAVCDTEIIYFEERWTHAHRTHKHEARPKTDGKDQEIVYPPASIYIPPVAVRGSMGSGMGIGNEAS